MLKQHRTTESCERSLDALAFAVEHVRRCQRCIRFFAAAHEVVESGGNQHEEFRPWGLMNLILPDLRRCHGWPREV